MFWNFVNKTMNIGSIITDNFSDPFLFNSMKVGFLLMILFVIAFHWMALGSHFIKKITTSEGYNNSSLYMIFFCSWLCFTMHIFRIYTSIEISNTCSSKA